MSNNSSICIIIAAYNAKATIGDAVASALSQSVVTEVVVVDDASTDDTCAMAQAAAVGDARLRVVQMQINGGVSAARNRGIAESAAPFISLLDSDDYYLEDQFR